MVWWLAPPLGRWAEAALKARGNYPPVAGAALEVEDARVGGDPGGSGYDLLLANDLMAVAVFTARLRQAGIKTPVATYFHENQISYPVSPRDTDLTQARDLHYGFINYTTALVSDKLYFNSHYHQDSFLAALPAFLGRYPDHDNMATVDEIAAKAEVLPLGIDLQALVPHKPQEDGDKQVPLILWNHRWEFDKCPEVFLQLLLDLRQRDLVFKVALLGERGTEEPPLLDTVRKVLGDDIVQDGPVESFAEYAGWLWRADIIPVTGIQDFFGGSVVEAIYTGCHPVLPRRLAYPEHLSEPGAFYNNADEAVEMVAHLIESGNWRQPSPHVSAVARYDWTSLVSQYDEAFAAKRSPDSP